MHMEMMGQQRPSQHEELKADRQSRGPGADGDVPGTPPSDRITGCPDPRAARER